LHTFADDPEFAYFERWKLLKNHGIVVFDGLSEDLTQLMCVEIMAVLQLEHTLKD